MAQQPTTLPKRRYKSEFQEKLTAFVPTEPEPLVLDTPTTLKLVGAVVAISAVTTVVIGVKYHFIKKLFKK